MLVPNPARAEWNPTHPERHARVAETKLALASALPLIETAAGHSVQGTVSTRHDLMDAVEESLQDQRFDEIILAVAPANIEGRLHIDLPHPPRTPRHAGDDRHRGPHGGDRLKLMCDQTRERPALGSLTSLAMSMDCASMLRTIRSRGACHSGRRPGLGRRVFETAMHTSRTSAVDLYWIPLGAGGRSVRFNGRVFEAVEAARRHRQRCDLYHAVLVVELTGDRYAIELAPSPDADEASRGVVGTGAVGSRHIGWLRLFRYEVRCWRSGTIPDLGEAVGGPRRLTADPRVVRRLLDLVAAIPKPVWGRDELKAGEMWNSNSMIAWLIATAGLSTGQLRPPRRGRAPGWHAGIEVARRGGAHVHGPAEAAEALPGPLVARRPTSASGGADEGRTMA